MQAAYGHERGPQAGAGSAPAGRGRERLSDARKEVRASACCLPVVKSIILSGMVPLLWQQLMVMSLCPAIMGPSQKSPQVTVWQHHPLQTAASHLVQDLCWHANAERAPQ